MRGAPRASWLLGLALLASALALRAWVFGLVSVPTASMAPGVLPGEVLLYWKAVEPRVGDVVVVDRDDGVLHVKRVVAGPGQEVEIASGELYVDGRRVTGEGRQGVRWVDSDCTQRSGLAVPESIGDRRWRVIPGGALERERIPDGALFLLGDHRQASSDSRQWGPARREAVRGVVAGIAWSRTPCGSLRLDRVGWSAWR